MDPRRILTRIGSLVVFDESGVASSENRLRCFVQRLALLYVICDDTSYHGVQALNAGVLKL